jgi:16S rRNA (adenine1518-N6/adenine1519-N6)-dimethyltransferase
MVNFAHKRSLGQNFLVNAEVVANIADAARLVSTDTVVEIGPGHGVLTTVLAQRAEKVIAIELDDRLIPVLREKFLRQDNVAIIHNDILHINMSDCAAEHGFDDYVVIGNIPYYITAPIIRFFLENPHRPREIILMVQKEVAERITAAPGNMSILSIAAQYYADVEYLFTVPRTDFEPQPKVDSAVIRFSIKKIAPGDADLFFRVVKIGFSARRKTLCNNLANGLHSSKEDICVVLEKMGLATSVRAQELSLADWGALRTYLQEGGFIQKNNEDVKIAP